MIYSSIMRAFTGEWLVGKIIDHRAVPLSGMEECDRACEILNRRHGDVVGTELRAAIDRSGLDISLCRGCGKVVVCIPDGLSNMCEACACKETEASNPAGDRPSVARSESSGLVGCEPATGEKPCI